MSSARIDAKNIMRPISAALLLEQSRYIRRPPIKAARSRYAMRAGYHSAERARLGVALTECDDRGDDGEKAAHHEPPHTPAHRAMIATHAVIRARTRNDER